MRDSLEKGRRGMHDFNWLVGEKAQVILAGALGGLVRWMTLQERMAAGMVSILVGAICAAYLGPVVGPLLEPFIRVVLTEESSRATFSGFVIGLSGIGLAGFIIDIVRARRQQISGKVDDNG